MNKSIKLFFLFAGLTLISVITAQSLSAVLAFKRGVLNNWADLTNYKADIDKAIYYGADSFSPSGPLPAYIAGVKNGNHDYIGDGVTYAYSKGVKTYFFMVIGKYTGDDYEAFKNSTSAQNQFLSDLEWVLQHYPTLAGIEMEEPHFHGSPVPNDGGAAWRAFTNSFFTKCKNVIAKYKPTDQPDVFVWSFNSASNSASNVSLIGIDTVYINANKLFNAFEIQNSAQSLSDYQYNVTAWQSRLPNLEVFSCTYLNWSSLCDACEVQYPNWDNPTCWNQAFFDQVKWAKSVGHSIRIFIHGRLTTSASMWPNDTTPGATAGEKVRYIWGGTQQAYSAGIPWLITTSTITPTKIESENFDVMSAGSGQNEAYYDTTLDNQGGAYRTTEYVDVGNCTDTGGGYYVGWTKPGEWLEYTINVTKSDEYKIKLRGARGGSGTGGLLHLEFGKHNEAAYCKTESVRIPTVSWTSWSDVLLAQSIVLTTGTQVMKLVMESGSAADCGNFNYISIVVEPDVTKPAVVNDLVVSNPTAGTISLSWTAVGDDGTKGTAKQYDIRYSSVSDLTESNWATATQCLNLPVPDLSKTHQSYVVEGLIPDTNYYFGIKVADEVPNWSVISNSPGGTTTSNNPPVLEWSGDTGYSADGVNPETGNVNTNYEYRVLYKDVDGNAPKSGYPRVHILKGGVEISGNPFVMTTTDDTSSYTVGRIYKYTTKLSGLGSDYSYYFDAQDINGGVSVPTTTKDSPDVSAMTYDIRGKVSEYKSPNNRISGVSMSLSGLRDADYTTSNELSADYNYEFVGLTSGIYTIEPSKTGWRFWPNKMEYTMFDSNLVNQDYVGRPFSVTRLVNPMVQVSSGIAVTPMGDNSSVDSEISVTVPLGAFSLITTLTLTSTEVPASNNKTIKVVGYGVDIINDKNLQPVKGIIITITYDDSAISGYNKDNLVIGRYDDNDKSWVGLPTTKSGTNKLVAGSNHLSKFALLELVSTIDLSNIKIYPNPYNPATAVSGKLKVTNLPMNSVMKLYSITGELVRELKEIDFGNLGWLEWDGKNDDGDKVSKGVYIYQIEDTAGKKKAGKIGLIK
ncbi:MAG: carbohydrate-binding protein [Elusimicrobia bacterium]|nr:carbohydrate-binding protein [Elusimicrobiota bacterium]